MKGKFVTEITKNTRVESIFLVKEKHMGVTKNGAPYLSLRLMDRTGDINARVWDEVKEYDALFEKGDFIKVLCRSSIYQGAMQLTIKSLKKCDKEKISLEDFLPACPFPVEEMLKELKFIINDIHDDYLKKLMKLFLEDEAFMKKYAAAPAAKAMHHVYLGGVLEHSLSIARLARMVSDNYDHINRDLLVCGALLHDIGKVDELSYQKAFDYTDMGRLLGHITIGVEMIEEKIKKISEFPPDLRMVLKHMILSHHGVYEYGSPKRPKTIEALLLYYLDDLDAKMNGFQQAFSEEDVDRPNWSRYHKLFDRYLFKHTYRSKNASESDNSEMETSATG